MYLCVCKAITLKEFQNILQEEKGDALRSCERLGVGGDCGSCLHQALNRITIQDGASILGGPPPHKCLHSPKK